MGRHHKVAHFLLKTAEDAGVHLTPQLRVLDFGCGDGGMVAEFHHAGLPAMGVDVIQAWTPDTPHLHLASLTPYRLPFADDSFDLIVSNQVLEHTPDHEACFREIRRVLAPNGVTIHLFPVPWHLPFEPHSFIPLGSRITADWWIHLWAWLGIRNQFQQGLHWREVARLNIAFKNNHLFYLPRKQMRQLALKTFGNVEYPYQSYIRHASGGVLPTLARAGVPFMAHASFAFRNQVIVMRKD